MVGARCLAVRHALDDDEFSDVSEAAKSRLFSIALKLFESVEAPPLGAITAYVEDEEDGGALVLLVDSPGAQRRLLVDVDPRDGGLRVRFRRVGAGVEKTGWMKGPHSIGEHARWLTGQ